MRSLTHAPGAAFPTTRVSVIRDLGSPDEAVRRPAFEALVSGYWKPAYKYFRLRWGLGPEDAEDATQDFFARVFEKRSFDRYDPARARFRTYFRACLDRFAANRRRAERRWKRGGGVTELPLDFAAAEGEIARAGGASATAAAEADPEAWFRREWRRELFHQAVGALRERCRDQGKEERFEVFTRYDLQGRPGLTYARLGEELGMPASRVTRALAWARRELRRLVLERLAALCGSEAELAAEARELLGDEPS